jgi:hypothetical protein
VRELSQARVEHGLVEQASELVRFLGGCGHVLGIEHLCWNQMRVKWGEEDGERSGTVSTTLEQAFHAGMSFVPEPAIVLSFLVDLLQRPELPEVAAVSVLVHGAAVLTVVMEGCDRFQGADSTIQSTHEKHPEEAQMRIKGARYVAARAQQLQKQQ